MSGALLLLVAGVLATWRLTHLIVAEDGPWNVVARLRRIAGPGFLGQMMDCFDCCSIWVALPMSLPMWPWLGDDWPARLVAWLAVSGGAILLERLIPPRPPAGN